jgi:N-acetylglucosaminyldiphosphoundecaprenol N-acetyl-beta-D-mannosaminyltransferase
MNSSVVVFFGYKISTFIPFLNFDKKIIINTINAHSFCLAKNDKNFHKSLLDSDILIPDGIGIVLAIKYLFKKNIYKISGSDLHFQLLNLANINSLKLFYLGSNNETLIKIKNRLLIEYPNSKVEFYPPPFKDKLDYEDNIKIFNAINNFKPDILFVGMTAPKQEIWVHENKMNIQANIICSIGAVFDFYSCNINRAPKWMINLGLEWLHRVYKNPIKLGKKSIRSIPFFIYYMLTSKYKL